MRFAHNESTSVSSITRAHLCVPHIQSFIAMGWFWDSNNDGSSKDPYGKLDPSLKEFLAKESSSKQQSSAQPPRQPPSYVSVPTAHDRSTSNARPTPSDSVVATQTKIDSGPNETRAVPRESLYQDGRYAHLWKTYRPQGELEDAGKSDADKLSDIVATYNNRKAEVGRAALENCVDFQLAKEQCFRSGDWSKLANMCRDENRAFNRCFEMQSRFLRALGYLSTQRTPEEDERIQMHADKLYHEMLERERVAKEAKEKGLSAPEMPPLIQPEAATQALGPDSAYARARQKAIESGQPLNLSMFTPEKQQEIKTRIQGMTKDEQDLELQLLAAEVRASQEYAVKIAEHADEERKHRADRRERGKETVGDTIKRLWGWDK